MNKNINKQNFEALFVSPIQVNSESDDKIQCHEASALIEIDDVDFDFYNGRREITRTKDYSFKTITDKSYL